jgi:threonine aldolase
MRQAGIIAAAGIYALQNRVVRLADDHLMARRLAEGIQKIEGLETRLDLIRTNLVFFDLLDGKMTENRLVESAASRGVHFLPVGNRRFRLVTHFGLTVEDMDLAVKVLEEVMEG